MCHCDLPKTEDQAHPTQLCTWHSVFEYPEAEIFQVPHSHLMTHMESPKIGGRLDFRPAEGLQSMNHKEQLPDTADRTVQFINKVVDIPLVVLLSKLSTYTSHNHGRNHRVANMVHQQVFRGLSWNKRCLFLLADHPSA